MSRDTARFLAELGEWVAARADPGVEHRYGLLPDQHAVLRLPAGPGPHPIAVVLHGGFWRAAFTKANTSALSIALTERGFATWNVEYRRVGAGGGYPETLEDVAAACRAVTAVDAPLDLDRMVAVGHSAGGQLALFVAAEGLVRGAVSLAGVIDLDDAVKRGLGDDAVVEFLGGPPSTVADRYARADPLRRLPLGRPALLVHGRNDDRVPVEQMHTYAELAVKSGDDVALLEFEEADHFDVIDPRASEWTAIAAGIQSLVT